MGQPKTADLTFSGEEFRDWIGLLTTIEEAGTQLPCESFPEAYFPDRDGVDGNTFEVTLAKRMCKQCPVMNDCLAFAMKHRQTGIWGGMAERERDRFRLRISGR